MNKTKIEYCHYSWNPMHGCREGCEFCYARKLVNQRGLYGGSFEPAIEPGKLAEPYEERKASIIFACDMGDIFSDGVEDSWKGSIIDAAHCCWWHWFLFLTKHPGGYCGFGSADNCWYGTSITKDEDFWRVLSLQKSTSHGKKYIQFEPLLGDAGRRLEQIQNFSAWFKWVIIGRATNYKHEWNPDWAGRIIDFCREHRVPVFVKDNVKWPERIREFPPELDLIAGDLK